MRALPLQARRALERFADAATEFVTVFDPKAATLASDLAWRDLVKANDDWQEAQLVAFAVKRKRPSSKLKSARASKKKSKAEKREAKNAETAKIREAVFKRADNQCEALHLDASRVWWIRCAAAADELDHAFGRGKRVQRISNCLALCRNCHFARTNNKPSAEEWWVSLRLHFQNHGYWLEASEADARAHFAGVRARAELGGGL